MQWIAYKAAVMLIRLPVLLSFTVAVADDVYRTSIILANWYVFQNGMGEGKKTEQHTDREWKEEEKKEYTK